MKASVTSNCDTPTKSSFFSLLVVVACQTDRLQIEIESKMKSEL